ncbi:hypothetical protein J7F03_22105 [Streptomyces sp. ISL-43]|uniref:DUF6585 family protein n=1 Tax=Streptomyces sp. ISL-43 TaxID=2819183 RepID=UPI001BEC63FE|nr:DUF6585 family protein [Streptomyces sp. ISL-43]MBT2449722.1 hypothetical protein [Streptomyces sp. ISL-43]
MDEKDTYEQPTASAAELAAGRGLGDWLRTFRMKQSRMFGKHNASRLYIYAGGAVVTGPEGFEAAHDWETMRVLRYLSTRNGAPWDARYTLLDPSGAAVNIGPGTRVFLKEDRQALGITSVVQGALFLWPNAWGEHIQNAVTRVQLPKVLARIERGETVDFGPDKVDRRGLAGRKHAAAWSEITDISSYSGTLIFNGSLKRTTVDSVGMHNIANLDLFLNLCQRFKG